jgi:hypothetical protein
MVSLDYLFALLFIASLYLMIHAIHWPRGHSP